MSNSLQYPIVACGYLVDLGYMAKLFRFASDDDDLCKDIAARVLESWYFHDLDVTREERAYYPRPGRCVYEDGTYDKIRVLMYTRLEVIRKMGDIDDHSYEMDSDVEKRDNFIKSLASIRNIQEPFDITTLTFN
ncbi:hypothetical protein BDN70DRAFT_888750 [Pholiota conissans]|uniref:Uncharacterized protein n=1 Tax=Pholiota conissans TaxID=109636 RepID=A0A9P6CS79_9AGAR|nr:hypothetical protein BDN70DRAFT_888750 [Pholiota conissans]